MSFITVDNSQSSGAFHNVDRDILNTVYSGKVCILTGEATSIDWSHILPFGAGGDEVLARDKLADLGLVPRTMRGTSYLNILPQRHLTTREQLLARGGPDPGRLPYEDSYALCNKEQGFNVFFGSTVGVVEVLRRATPYRTHPSSENEPFASYPPITLCASVAIMVSKRTGVLGEIVQSGNVGEVAVRA
ncbi:hypothetical protein FRB94_000895 [Tulasnella sp. JGI-2019a]|nr:hypothetical protein FRB94_000895 [Tulasnella sp. JGI-2019a]